MYKLLIEVPPSPTNVAHPEDETDESQLEEWLAVEGGGFEKMSPVDVVTDVSRQISRMTTCAAGASRRQIRKRRFKKSVQYFDADHCENTACTFSCGHAGLCSHQLVSGKRGGRPTATLP
jgi:hypothetical protein